MALTRDEKLAALREHIRTRTGSRPAPAPGAGGRAHLPVLDTCQHLGERVPGQPCGSQLMRCTLKGGLTTRFMKCDQAEHHCATCKDFTRAARPERPKAPVGALPGTGTVGRFEWVSTRRLVSDSIALAAVLPGDCAGIVGVPRSGMLPASVIATHMHLPLYTFDGGQLVRCSVGGSRGNVVRGGAGPLAVIDDTTFSGTAMRRTRQLMTGRPAVFCAVYVNPLRPESKAAVDYYARELPAPHLLEWNWANNGPMAGAWADVPAYGRGIAVDLDGVIVHDELSGGPPGRPYLLPRMHAVKLIATGRAERYRRETEAMLRGLGVRWERLEMLPDHVPLNVQTAAAHKAKHLATSGCGLFVESCPDQAKEIHRQANKPVICPRIERVFQ